MDLREVVEKYKQFKVPSLSTICETASQYSKTCLLAIIILFIVFVYLVQQIPHWQVAQFGIINPKDIADAENSYRATLAQIFGGIAIAIGLYYTWRRITIAEEDLKATKEGQITERFTRAVEQLGNPAIEIRLGGIYALERIANESKKDHWPIMEILTAYVRKNSSLDNGIIKGEGLRKYISISLDIQAILTVIGRRKYFYNSGEDISLDLEKSILQGANLIGANLDEANLIRVNLKKANLEGANLKNANLEGANLSGANLEGDNLERAKLIEANIEFSKLKRANLEKAKLICVNLRHSDLEKANLEGANLSGADLIGANFEKANLKGANFESSCYFEERGYRKEAQLIGAYFIEANLEGANFEKAQLYGTYLKGANLKGAKNLTVDQLSKVETLYQAKLDPELEEELRSKGYSHLLDDEP